MSLKDWESFPTEDQLPNTCPACQQKPSASLSNLSEGGTVKFQLECEDHATEWCTSIKWAIIQWNLATAPEEQWKPIIQQLAEHRIKVKPFRRNDEQ